MMNHSKIAKKHQQMPVNILADIGTLAKTMPDILRFIQSVILI
ncbi:hypothetical protein VFC2065_25280 [Listeria monocytogenes]